MSLSPRIFGLGTALAGVAHLVKPDAFVPMTQRAFPDNTEEWVKRNGITETAIGTAFLLPKTRGLGKAGLLAYVGWLGFNVAKVNAAAKTA